MYICNTESDRIVAKMLDGDILVSEFKLHSLYYVHNTVEKVWTL